MSEENKEEEGIELTHGHEIHAGDHRHALDFVAKHMSEAQVNEMVRTAKNGDGAHFMVSHGGEHKEYKLVHSDGKLKIHSV